MKYNIKKLYKLNEWYIKLEKDNIRTLDDIRTSFLEWIRFININEEDINSIENSIHLLNDGKLLFRTSTGKLNIINFIIKKSSISKSELVTFAKEKSIELWNREFDIEIELVNTKWKTKNASYIFYKDGRKVIRFSKYRNFQYTKEYIFKTLLHELVHWHLHTSGLPFKDSDREFVEECVRVGANISGTNIAQKAFKKYGN